jgi:N-acetyl-anhydromuramyl-L-alanine amidase AmpD
MRIEKDHIVRSKFHRGKSRKAYRGKVKEVVIHGTAGGGTLEWVRNGGRAEQYYKAVGLFHYLIERDGEIWEIIDPDRWTYHSCRGNRDKNSIGIEMENPDRQNRGHYTDAQYESLHWLIYEYLMDRYPSISVIMSHKRAWQKVSKGRRWKECPGVAFEWSRLEEYMYNNNISYDHNPAYESYWHVKKV